jgi:hypothetical protein
MSSGPTDTDPANNSAWYIGLESNNELRWLHEYGSGNNAIQIYDDAICPAGLWTHFAFVRDDSASTVTLYVNGHAVPTVYNYGANSATGGSAARLSFGGFWQSDVDFFRGHLAALKVIPSTITAAQALAEAQLVLPPQVRP